MRESDKNREVGANRDVLREGEGATASDGAPPRAGDVIHGRDQLDSVRTGPSTRTEAQQPLGRGSRDRNQP